MASGVGSRLSDLVLIALGRFLSISLPDWGRAEDETPSLSLVVQPPACPTPLPETGSHIAQIGLELPRLPYVAENDLEPLVLLHLPPECWGCRPALLHLVLCSARDGIQGLVCARRVIASLALERATLVSSVHTLHWS